MTPSSAADDDAIDELYRAPLNEFTAKRNALVKSLRGADATHVRKLEKPSVVAWAVNQVYWNARPLYERVIKSGERLRKTQIAALEGKSADVRGATEGHRHAVAEASAEAERLGNASGLHPARDALMRTFEAISLAPEPPEHPGRLTETMQPAGFEALTGITPQAAAIPKGRERREEPEPVSRERGVPSTRTGQRSAAALAREKEAERERQKQEAEDARRQAAEEKQRQAERRKLEAAVERARDVEAKTRADWERARDALREAEKQLKSTI